MRPIFHSRKENIADVLGVVPGITALVGGGGKTTLMYALASALSARGRVIVTTSTHIFPPKHLEICSNPDETALCEAFLRQRILCVGVPDGSGKLTAPPLSAESLLRFCDYIIVEADGAKRLPLKAPADHEPVIPPGTSHVIAVAGLDGIGHPISKCAFRADRYAALLGKRVDDIVSARDAAVVLQHPNGQRKNVTEAMRFSIVLNKADTEAVRSIGETVAGHIDAKVADRVLITSLGRN